MGQRGQRIVGICVLVTLFAASACGPQTGAGPEPVSEPIGQHGGPSQPSQPPVEANMIEVDPSVDLSVAEVQQAASVYTLFLGLRDAARAGQENALEAIENIASPRTTERVQELADQQGVLRENAGIATSFKTIPAIRGAFVNSDGSVRISDCAEVWQDDGTGTTRALRFVDQSARLTRNDDDRWIVHSIQEPNQTNAVGCVPRHRQDELAALASQAYKAIQDAYRTGTDLPGSVTSTFNPDLSARMENNLAAIGEQRRLVGPHQAKVALIGQDNRQNEMLLVVGMCGRYPEGKLWEWTDSSERVVEEPLVRGVEFASTFSVSVEPAGVGELTYKIQGLEDPSVRTCWQHDMGYEVLSWD